MSDMELFQHQNETIDFVIGMEERPEDGIPSYLLCHQMGLGKTLPVCITFLRSSRKGRTLLVLPKNAVRVWRETLEQAFKHEGRRMHVIEVLTSKFEQDDLPEEGIFITTYNIVQILYSKMNFHNKNKHFIYDQRWTRIVFDEIHAVKTPTAKKHEACLHLKSTCYGGITATPVQKNVTDVNAIAAILHINRGYRMIGHHMLKRTMEEVSENNKRFKMIELEQNVVTSPFMSEEEKMAYIEELDSATQRGSSSSRSIGIDKFNRLRMLSVASCCIGGNRENMFGEEGTYKDWKSTKMNMLVRHVKENKSDDFLVFSQWTSALRVAEKALVEAGITSVAVVLGKTPTSVFDSIVANLFAKNRTRRPRVLLASLEAYYMSVNLQMCNHVVFLEPHLNATKTDQGTGRARRPGQERVVKQTHLIIEGTIENRVMQIGQSKRELASTILDPSNSHVYNELILKGVREELVADSVVEEYVDERVKHTTEQAESRHLLKKCFGEVFTGEELDIIGRTYKCKTIDDFDHPDSAIGLPYPAVAFPEDVPYVTKYLQPFSSNEYRLTVLPEAKKMNFFRVRTMDEFLLKVKEMAKIMNLTDPRFQCGRIHDIANALRSTLSGEVVENLRATKIFCWGVYFEDGSILAFWPLKIFEKNKI